MTANQLAVWVLWYGVGYAVLLHGNIWAGLVGFVLVALLVQGSYGDDGMLAAYTLGLMAQLVLRLRWFRFLSWSRWGWLRWLNPLAWLRERWERQPRGSGLGGSDSDAGTRTWGNSSSRSTRDDARAEAERRRREDEARQRRDREDARRGYRGSQGAPRDEPGGKSSKEEKTETSSRKEEQTPDAQTDNRTPEEILGVCPGCTYEELKQAYRLQCQRLHPDRWQDRPPHIRAMLEKEQKKVNVAFQGLGKRFNNLV